MTPLLLLRWSIGIALFVSACNTAIISGESPLATWNPSDSDTFLDASSAPGTLEITSDCVHLLTDDGRTVLLVWPEPTTWNASSQMIEFVGVRGERLNIQEGVRFVAGGYTAVVFKNTESGEPDIGELEYTLPPNPNCKASSIFVVNSVEILTE